MAVAFSQKVRSGCITRGVAEGKARVGRWGGRVAADGSGAAGIARRAGTELDQHDGGDVAGTGGGGIVFEEELFAIEAELGLEILGSDSGGEERADCAVDPLRQALADGFGPALLLAAV